MGNFKTTLGASVAAAAVTAVLASTPAAANTVLGSDWAVPTSVAMNAIPSNVPTRTPDSTFSSPSTPLDLSSTTLRLRPRVWRVLRTAGVFGDHAAVGERGTGTGVPRPARNRGCRPRCTHSPPAEDQLTAPVEILYNRGGAFSGAAAALVWQTRGGLDSYPILDELAAGQSRRLFIWIRYPVPPTRVQACPYKGAIARSRSGRSAGAPD